MFKEYADKLISNDDFIYLISDTKMATLRSGRKIDSNGNEKLSEKVTEDDNSKDKPVKDKTTLVIFLGLLIDLLGKQ